MYKEDELLNHVHQTTEMGREGILAVMKYAKEESFRQALQQQLTEYEKLNSVCDDMLQKRGKQPEEVNPVAKVSSQLMSSMKLMNDRSTSKIAEMMIQGNTMGMTKSLQHLHDYQGEDERVRDLADKLLKTEESNITQMKKFL